MKYLVKQQEIWIDARNPMDAAIKVKAMIQEDKGGICFVTGPDNIPQKINLDDKTTTTYREASATTITKGSFKDMLHDCN